MIRELLPYWPRPEEVAACMKVDAESASEAVFLSVHQPVVFRRKEIGSQTNSLRDCDENEFLQALLEPNLSDGRIIVPLIGTTGSGKSHIVRWIEASLNRLPDADRRIIIRIPKGTSLKGAIGRLLEKLDGPEYEPFRVKLQSAQEQLEPEQSAGLLCEMLALTLIEKAEAARTQLLVNPSNKLAREVSEFGRSSALPTLLRSNELRERHFVREPGNNQAPIRRLVEQLTVGRDSSEDDDRKHLFVPEDLNFEVVRTDDLGTEQKNAIAQIARQERRGVAAKVLNQALDEAKQKILGIDPTVTDLFDAVRTKLLEQNKELVLLVEDFVVLSGIQKQLLQVIIKEAIRDGQQVLCTMRTVLAYTTGYLDTATVLSRAGVEYEIPDNPGSETEILSRTERLVGAYLNAARNGQERLKEAYTEAAKQGVSNKSWVPVFEAPLNSSSESTLKDFETSEDGYELFPFNRSAIRELSLEGCTKDGHFIYNPRFVIHNVLTKVLKNRTSFEEGTFPSESFRNAGRHLPARIVEEVRSSAPPEDYDRWVRFFSYWGGRPNSTEELSQFSPRVAKAFGLDPRPFKPTGQVPGHPQPPSGPAPKPTTGSRPIEGVIISDRPDITGKPERNESEVALERSLELWRNGQRMGQSDANALRKLLADATNGFITWDWDLFKPSESVSSFFRNIYIPNAQGNSGNTEDSTSTMFSVCSEADLKSPERSAQIILAILAAHRFHIIHKASWNYPDAQADLPHYSALIQGYVDRARSYVMARYFKALFDPIPALVQGLLIGARVLGLDPPTRGRDVPSAINSLFANPSLANHNPSATTSTNPTALSEWQEFLSALRACRSKNPASTTETWIDHLLNLLGARQGGARTVYAIDSSRLRLAIEHVLDSWAFDAVIPAGYSNELDTLRKTHAGLKSQSRAIEKEADDLKSWHKEVVSWAGQKPDKEALADKLRTTIEEAKASGLTVGLEPIMLGRLVDEFGRSAFKAAFDDIERLLAAKSRGTLLSILGSNHQPTIELSRNLEKKFAAFLAGVQTAMEGRSLNLGLDPKAEAVGALRTQVSDLLPVLKEISEL